MKLPVQMNSPLFIDSLCLPIFVWGKKNDGIAGRIAQWLRIYMFRFTESI
jgi:hypothetical protein